MRFQISGAVGTALYFVLYNALLAVYPPHWPYHISVCLGLAYAASILWQHSLHRFFVFGFGAPYLRSLCATYAAYALSMVASPFITEFFVQSVGVGAQAAWFLGLIICGVLNYFTVSKAFESSN